MISRCPFWADNLPLLFSSILFFTILASFIISLAQHDVTPWFPTISDTATTSPESNIFSQFVNIATFVGLILIYIRFLQVKKDLQWLQNGRTTLILNKCDFWIGLIAIIGCSMVANFPETQVEIAHVVGALLLFVFGNIYVWVQFVISFNMKRMGVIGSCSCVARFIFASLSTISFAVMTIMMNSATKKNPDDIVHWHSDDPGYKEHIIASGSEWIMVFSFLAMFLTFIGELAYTRIQVRLVGGLAGSYEPINPLHSSSIDV